MTQLLDTLINQGILCIETVVTVGVRSRREPRDYIVTNISTADLGYRLDLRELDGAKTMAVASHDITAVDGMSIERYADVYNINSDGSSKSVGKKRGRKPKIR